eukprot:TRINITY_DN2802_c1_g1_i1.p1 TRINITY_DN2802_c1_g1~~TRINITY_DN2802_c1_g1_i1.p1  ORF type:complete len:110 (-),score=9.17 TRINITY_DN2802_c1_g1_i1:16-345(-)
MINIASSVSFWPLISSSSSFISGLSVPLQPCHFWMTLHSHLLLCVFFFTILILGGNIFLLHVFIISPNLGFLITKTSYHWFINSLQFTCWIVFLSLAHVFNSIFIITPI